jgi:hypothetical protein
MTRFRIIPSPHDPNYFQLERRTLFGWEYVKLSRDKDELRKTAAHLSTEPEYLS